MDCMLFVSIWFIWRGQCLGLSPRSHPRRHLVHRLYSVLVIGNQRIGSSKAVGRQQESNFEPLCYFWESRPCRENRFLMCLKVLRLGYSTKGDMTFQSESLNSLCYCWCLSCMGFFRRVFAYIIKTKRGIELGIHSFVLLLFVGTTDDAWL